MPAARTDFTASLSSVDRQFSTPFGSQVMSAPDRGRQRLEALHDHERQRADDEGDGSREEELVHNTSGVRGEATFQMGDGFRVLTKQVVDLAHVTPHIADINLHPCHGRLEHGVGHRRADHGGHEGDDE